MWLLHPLHKFGSIWLSEMAEGQNFASYRGNVCATGWQTDRCRQVTKVSVNNWVNGSLIVSDFRDSYSIYWACELVKPFWWLEGKISVWHFKHLQDCEWSFGFISSALRKVGLFWSFCTGEGEGRHTWERNRGIFSGKNEKRKETVGFFQRKKKNSFRLNSASKSANNFTFYHKKPLANMLVRSQ